MTNTIWLIIIYSNGNSLDVDGTKLRNHSLHFLIPKVVSRDSGYNLKLPVDYVILFGNVRKCKTKKMEDFVTFKYF